MSKTDARKNLELARNWPFYERTAKLQQYRKSGLSRRIRNCLDSCLKLGFTEESVIGFLGKYAKRYEVTLTFPMVTTLKSKVMTEANELNIEFSTEWDDEKEFLSKDVMAMKNAGLSSKIISRLFLSLLDFEIFSEKEIQDFSSESYIEMME